MKYIFHVPDFNIELAKKMTDQTAEEMIKAFGAFDENKRYHEVMKSVREQPEDNNNK